MRYLFFFVDYADKVLEVLRKEKYQPKNMWRDEVSSGDGSSEEEPKEQEPKEQEPKIRQDKPQAQKTSYMSGRKKKFANDF